MRLESKHQVSVKNIIIGGARPLVCLPLVAEKEGLLSQAGEMATLAPDLIEWRVDGYAQAMEIPHCLQTLKELQRIIDPAPLIFTCRIEAEKGLQQIPDPARLDLILGAMDTGLVDIVDTELCNTDAFIDTVIRAGKRSHTKVLLSSHDFEMTPTKRQIIDKLARAQELGADIAKLAVMPHEPKDVLTLMEATLEARNGRVDIPMITISMGEMGAVSRVSGGLFGSDITFAMTDEGSAPGQIPIQALRQAMAVLYPDQSLS